MSKIIRKGKLQIIVLIIIVFAILLTGCEKSSFTIINGSIDRKDDEVVGSYDKYNGYTEYTLEFGKPLLKWLGNSKDEDGKLYITLKDKDGEVLLEWDNPKAQEIEINVEPKEKYYLRIVGENHKGEFSVHWE